MNIGYALTGSFCTFDKSIKALEKLVDEGHTVTPIMSFNAYNTDTRFGKARDINRKIENITGKNIIHTILDAEPVGPKRMFDILVVAPCTSNTLSKLANGINDTPVTMAVKSHLRNNKPVIIGVSTNDALGISAKNIGALLNFNNYFFVPMDMDNPTEKPRSVVCDFSKIVDTIEMVNLGKQPIYF